MKYHNLGSYKTITDFVNYKLASLNDSETSFAALFELMFSECSNTIYEYTYGYDVKRVTYQESKNSIISLSRKIASLNLTPGSVIAIYLDNDLTWIETFWAILRSGHNALLLNTRLDDTSLNEAIKETHCELVISKRKKFDTSFIFYKDLLLKEESEVPASFGNEILFMSSGTTDNVKISAYGPSEIKAVLLQSADIIQANKKVKRHYEGELKLLAFLPFYHIFGFIAVYTWFSFYARTFVGLNDLSPQTIKNTITKHKVTHIFAVPLFFEKTYEAALKEIKRRGDKTYAKFNKGMNIADKLGNSLLGKLFSKLAFKEVREKMLGDSISVLITGGSTISLDTLRFFNNIGYYLTNGYGMTEIGITSVELSLNKKYLVNGSIGNPLHGLTYKINDNNELLVKGPTLAKYIISNHQKLERNEFFNTHDLMEYKGGRYYFLGREDDLIVSSNGENLNPNIIEQRIRLTETPYIALISNSTNAEPVLLVEVNKYLSKDKLLELDHKIKDNIALNHYDSLINKIIYIKEPLLKGEEFKINRKRLVKEYFSNKLSIYDLANKKEESNHDEVLEKVLSLIKECLSVNEVDINQDLMMDLGASSMDYYAIASNIYDEFNVSIIDVEGVKYRTPQAISDFIKEQL